MLNKKLTKFITLLFLSISFFNQTAIKAEIARNEYPIVLVNGMNGWERNEMLGFRYYGGICDIETMLNKESFKTYSAFIGPYSSTWDQAVELYYYIKGGTVDYGAAHSKEYGHDRFGQTYPGIYNEWDETNKVHLVGHSMGGTASRLLVELLQNGDLNEQEYFEKNETEGISPLFQDKGRKWIHSVTSLATPHNGTTVFETYQNTPITLKQFVLKTATMMNTNTNYSLIQDFKLGHWGLKREENESYESYLNRVCESNIWDSKDTAFDVLVRDESAKLNKRVSTFPDVYYFSYHGDASYKDVFGYSKPKPSLNPMILFYAIPAGKSKDKEWRPNDGSCPVISAKYPFGHPNKSYDGIIAKGVWNVYPTMMDWDHLDFLGIDRIHNFEKVHSLYIKIGNTLTNLPK